MNLFEVNSVGALVRFEILMGFETCFFMLTNFFGRKYNYSINLLFLLSNLFNSVQEVNQLKKCSTKFYF